MHGLVTLLTPAAAAAAAAATPAAAEVEQALLQNLLEVGSGGVQLLRLTYYRCFDRLRSSVAMQASERLRFLAHVLARM